MPQSSPHRAGRRASPLMRPWVWLKRFFVRPVHLVRHGRQLRVVFEETRCNESTLRGRGPGASAAATPATIHAELRRLLDQHAGTRQLMRHLAFIERALQLRGEDAFDNLPAEVAATALVQLERLVADWSSAGLAALRVRLLTAVESSQKQQEFEPTNSKMSEFNAPGQMQVSEGTPSTFEELQRIWTEHRPDQKSAVASGER